MDTKLIQQYGESIHSYRMRTARQKIRMQYEDFDKYLIQLRRQEIRISQQKRDMGWEKLDMPYQRGWVRYFVLDQKIAAGRHSGFLEGILRKINVYQYNWRKDFKKRKRKGGKKNYIPVVQNLLKPNEWKFNEIKFTAEEKEFFNEVWEINAWRKLEKRYEFKYPEIFVLKVAPYMVDKVKIKDALLESESQLLNNRIRENDYRKRQSKIFNGHYSGRSWKDDERVREKNIFKGKQIVQILDWVDESRYADF